MLFIESEIMFRVRQFETGYLTCLFIVTDEVRAVLQLGSQIKLILIDSYNINLSCILFFEQCVARIFQSVTCALFQSVLTSIDYPPRKELMVFGYLKNGVIEHLFHVVC